MIPFAPLRTGLPSAEPVCRRGACRYPECAPRGVCRRFIPDVLKTLADSRVVCRVVVVSREGVESARRDFGAAVEVAALTSELALGLSVRGYPDVLVVRSGRVLHRQEGISPTTGRQLVDLLR